SAEAAASAKPAAAAEARPGDQEADSGADLVVSGAAVVSAEAEAAEAAGAAVGDHWFALPP
ncbi:MAG: hypothetical protein ACXWH0_15650, partial [Acidimicrobiia bacterium]